MVNPGTFRGSRREFMISELAAYTAGVDGGYAADALVAIQRKYFKRYPVDLPHDEEPSREFLDGANDDQAYPEEVVPDETLPENEYREAMKRHVNRGKLIEYRKSQIKRWLAYQYMKAHDVDSKDPSSDNPYHALLHQLAGTSAKKPRAKPPVNIWRKTHKEAIELEVKMRLHQTASNEGRLVGGGEHKKLAGIRERVVHEFFSALTSEEKDHWAELAKEDHDAAMDQWKKGNDPQVSSDPVNRQRCIGGLVQFAQPILDMIAETTGWKVTLMAGGPEPAHGGRLNIISLHSGTTTGDVKVHFGSSERVRYKKYIVPIFGDFLRRCYTPEECRARALPEESGLEGAFSMDTNDDGVNFDTLGMPGPAGNTTAPEVSTNEAGPPETPSTSTEIASSSTSAVPQPSRPRPPSPPSSSVQVPARSTANGFAVAPTSEVPPPSTTALAALTSRAPASAPASDSTPHPGISTSTEISHDSNPPAGLSTNIEISQAMAPHLPTPGLSADAVAAAVASEQTDATDEQVARLLHVFADEPRSRSTSVDPWDIPRPHPLSRAHSVASLVPSQHSSPPRSPPLSAAPMRPSKRPGSIPCEDEHPKKKAWISQGKRAGKGANRTGGRKVARKAAAKKTTTKGRGPSADDSTTLAPSSQPATSPSTSAAGLPEIPSDAPEWFQNATTLFAAADLGADWMVLCQSWSSFEIKSSFTSTSNLKTKNRPPAIAQWIQRKRSATWRPVISNVKDYATLHMLWWGSLQPTWRISEDGDVIVTETSGDWETLKVSGANGLLEIELSGRLP